MLWLFEKLGSRFLVTVFLFTRVFAVVAGALCVFYVNMTLNLQGEIRHAFTMSAFLFIGVAVVVTTLSSIYHTSALRMLLFLIEQGKEAPPELKEAAARQASEFPARNARWESLYDPFFTIIPICLMTWFWVHPPLMVLVQVFVAGFLGLACIILATFFLSERCLEPVVSHLQQHQIHFDFESLSSVTLKRRMQFGFGITILVTAIMIGGLAVQRSFDILKDPAGIESAVDNLLFHTFLITLAALTTGLLLANTVAGSVTQRTDRLVAAMKQVQKGDLSLRVQPAGNDEVDTLARQFNLMVEELDRNDKDLRELTENLERIVQQKTAELRGSFDQLTLQNQELEDALDQLKQMQNQLVQSEKMTSLGQLVAGLAHEINNSINVVHNGVPSLVTKIDRIQQLVKKASAPETSGSELDQIEKVFQSVHRLTGAIGDGAERTARIVRDMKQFSHPATENFIGVDVNESLDRCLNLLQVSKLSTVQIVKQYGELPQAVGSLGQLDQVFLNILSNAIDAICEQGIIEISTYQNKDQLEVSIKDNGPGMGPDIIKHIFDPFFTTKPPGKGTGLGMSISYGIVKQFGGELLCNSQPDAGAEFLIRIPLSVAQTVAQTEK